MVNGPSSGCKSVIIEHVCLLWQATQWSIFAICFIDVWRSELWDIQECCKFYLHNNPGAKHFSFPFFLKK